MSLDNYNLNNIHKLLQFSSRKNYRWVLKNVDQIELTNVNLTGTRFLLNFK